MKTSWKTVLDFYFLQLFEYERAQKALMYLQNMLMRWDSSSWEYQIREVRCLVILTRQNCRNSSQDPAFLDAIPMLWSKRLILILNLRHRWETFFFLFHFKNYFYCLVNSQIIDPSLSIVRKSGVEKLISFPILTFRLHFWQINQTHLQAINKSNFR